MSFNRIPFAAAFIGQVHTAVLAQGVSPTGCEEPVAVKFNSQILSIRSRVTLNMLNSC